MNNIEKKAQRGILSAAGLAATLAAVVATAGEPLSTPDQLHDLVKAVSADRLERDVTTLVGFGTRHTLSDAESEVRGIGAARRWIEAEFRRISDDCGGALQVFTQSEVVQGQRIPEPTEVVNVLAIQRGVAKPDR